MYLGVVESEHVMLLSSEIINRGMSYLPKRYDIYNKTHFPYLYQQTPLVLIMGDIGNSPKYSKTWLKIWRGVDLNTGI